MLGWPAAREWLGHVGLRQLSGLLQGEFHADGVEALAPWRLRLRGVRVDAPDGREVLRAQRLEVGVDLGALVRGQLRVRSVHVQAPRVSLRGLPDEPAIAQAFAPVPDDAPPEPEASDFALRVDGIEVQDLRVVDLPEQLGLSLETLTGQVRYDARGTRIDARVPALGVTREGAPVAAGSLEATLALVEAATSRAALQLRAGDSELAVDLQTRYEGETFSVPTGSVRANLHPELPARLGQPALSTYLRAPVSLELDAERDRVELSLHTRGGDLAAELDRQGAGYLLQLDTAHLDLRSTLGPDVPAPLRGRLRLALEPRDAGALHYDYRLGARGVHVAGVRIPELTMRGDVSEQRLRVRSLRVPEYVQKGEVLRLSGQVDRDGAARVRLEADLHEPLLGGALAQLAGVEGDALSVSLTGAYSAERAALNARLALEAQGLRAGPASLARLTADVTARGSLLRPALDARVAATDVRFPHGHIASAEAELSGAGTYLGNLRVRGEHAVVDGGVRLTLTRDSATLAGKLISQGRRGQPVRVELGEIRYRDQKISLSGLRLTSGRHFLRVAGHYHARRGGELQLDLSGFDLAQLSEVAFLEGTLAPYALSGELSGNVRFRGTLARPDLDAELRGEGLGARGVPLGNLHASLSHRRQSGSLEASLSLDPPNVDRVRVQVSGELPRRPLSADTLVAGRYQAEADVLLTSIESFAPFAPEQLDGISGGLDLKGQVSGSRAGGLSGELALSGTRLADRQLGPATFTAQLAMEPQRTDVSLSVVDDQGSLADAELQVAAGALRLLEAGTLPEVDWELRARVPERRLDALPAPARVEMPLRVDAALEASGTGKLARRVRAETHARWEGDSAEPLDWEQRPGCALGSPSASLVVQLEEGRLDAEGALRLDEQAVVALSSQGELPALRLDRFDPAAGALQVAAEARALELASLPWLCGRTHGQLSFDVTGEGLLSGSPRLDVRADVQGLAAVEGASLDVSLTARADARGATAEVRAREEGRDTLTVEGELPWRWNSLAVPEDLGEAALAVRFDQLPLRPLAAPLAEVAKLRGRVSGSAKLRQIAAGWDVDARLRLHDVYLGLAEPALRLERMNGQVFATNRALRFENLRWGDREGRLRSSGEVRLEDLKPLSADVEIEAEDLPLRADGVPFATIDTHTRVRADLQVEPAEVQVDILSLSVELAEELTRSTQDLEGHPDVVYVDELEQEAAAGAERRRDVQEPPKPFLVARISIETQKPFWVRHQDFAVQVEPKLRITSRDGGVRIAGPLVVHRGYVNLVGRTFNFERGELRFDGGDEVDPSVALSAKHFLRAGEYVEVILGGHLSKPTLEFRTNVAGVANNETEIMTLLVRGKPGSSHASASAEAAAMLSGLTAGFLSSLTRGKYGEYVPVLALEAGSGTGTRLRAGVQMDDFVPERLRSVVQGAYVEGYVGSGDTDQNTGQRGGAGGFLIELYLPRDLTASGSYDEPTNWSIDLLWEPLR